MVSCTLKGPSLLTAKIKSTLKDAAKKCTGSVKRACIAKGTEDYFDGSARKAERNLGWSRTTIHKGQKALSTGFLCIENYAARGRKKTEEKLPKLTQDMPDIVEGQSQVDPTFRSPLCDARISARAVRKALIQEKGYAAKDLPSRQTLGNVFNRLGYR